MAGSDGHSCRGWPVSHRQHAPLQNTGQRGNLPVRSVVPIVCVAGCVCTGDSVNFPLRNSSQDPEVGRNPGLTDG